MAYELIKVAPQPPIATITLDRPKVLNALSPAVISEVGEALRELDADESIRAVVITGGPKVFAAGADIGDMAERSAAEQLNRDQTGAWSPIRSEEHTSELQSRGHLVCRLLLEKKKH